MHPFLDHPGPLAFAHRGGAAEAPENTMAAFERAVRLGYRFLELDVRATEDGRLVVFHDATLDRVTDRRGRVGRLPWVEVRRARVDGEDIPLLAEVLSTWPEVRVNIDPKSDAAVGPLISVLRDADALDRVCVMAFSDRRLERLRAALGPDLCTALGPRSMTWLKLAANGVRVPPPTGDVAQVPAALGRVRVLDEAVVRAAAGHAVPVHAWVVDEEAEMRRLLDLGVDGLMTDHPERLRAVLEERGHWS